MLLLQQFYAARRIYLFHLVRVCTHFATKMEAEMKILDEEDSMKSSKSQENPDESVASASNNDSQEEDAEIADGRNADAGADTGENGRHKRHRKRKRHYYNEIRAQMEFYFGDANLSKDRFLMQKITEDPFVPLEMFLTFNKIKALTNSVQEIAKSLTNSKLLELDEMGHKVRRRTEIPKERNDEPMTLYVESLPPTADIEWVQKVFEPFGAVAYVSLPRCKKTRKIKGFAFIEFEKEESVEKALKAFKEFNGVLQVLPGELASVKSYNKEKLAMNAKKTDEEGTKSDAKQEDEEASTEPSAKRAKTEDVPANTATMEVKDEESNGTEEEPVTDDATKANDTETVKKRRRKKKKNSSDKRKKEWDPNAEAAYHELKILSKKDWRKLRNKYLQLQREIMGQFKRRAPRKPRVKETTDADQLSSPPSAVVTAAKGEKKLQKMNMNFYGAGAGEDDTQQQQQQPQQQLHPKGTVTKEAKQEPTAIDSAPPPFTFEAGLIIEVTLLEPCVNVKEFRAEMRQYSTVKYIDIKEGATVAHLRLESPTAAEEFVRKISCAEYKLKILTGDAEKDYWKRIEMHRAMKLSKNVVVAQKRGREKVKKLVAKHTHFEDDSD